jgi:hypothetical protein
LKLKCDAPLSTFAFNFNLRHYTKAGKTFHGKTLQAMTEEKAQHGSNSGMALEE